MIKRNGRPYRIFISGNCQSQFVYDALRFLYRGAPDISLAFRANYRPAHPGDDEAARQCDIHVMQVTNLTADPWAEIVPARTRRVRLPVLQLTGVFHAFAPRVHPQSMARGRPPFYLARGNKVLNDLAARFRRGENLEMLHQAYLDYSGTEIEQAPRLMELNIAAMRRVGRNADFDLWREIEPRLAQERFFWSVKHPTLATDMTLLRFALAALALPYEAADLATLAAGPEYHEPYHAPIHPRLAERLGLAWAGADTKYRFYQDYFTAEEHARRYIAGNFEPNFSLNRAIRNARAGADAKASAALFRSSRAPFPAHGQAEFWHGRVLQRLGRYREAALCYRHALGAARDHPHPVPHRADVTVAKIAACLKRCAAKRDKIARARASDLVRADISGLAERVSRLETYEAHLQARIRWWTARQKLAALRKEHRLG